MELKRRKGLSFRGIKRSVKNRALTENLPLDLKGLGHLRLVLEPEVVTATPQVQIPAAQILSISGYSEKDMVYAIVGAGAFGMIVGNVLMKVMQYAMGFFW